MSFELRSFICMLCLPLFLQGEPVIDYMWKYDTMTVDEFNYMEDYVAYKYLQSLDMAIEGKKDIQKFMYFSGKAAAYLDCIESSSTD